MCVRLACDFIFSFPFSVRLACVLRITACFSPISDDFLSIITTCFSSLHTVYYTIMAMRGGSSLLDEEILLALYCHRFSIGDWETVLQRESSALQSMLEHPVCLHSDFTSLGPSQRFQKRRGGGAQFAKVLWGQSSILGLFSLYIQCIHQIL